MTPDLAPHDTPNAGENSREDPMTEPMSERAELIEQLSVRVNKCATGSLLVKISAPRPVTTGKGGQ